MQLHNFYLIGTDQAAPILKFYIGPYETTSPPYYTIRLLLVTSDWLI